MFENIDWIFFDIGSTLVDESRAYQRRIEEAIFGTNITYQQFYDTMMVYYRNNQKGDLKTIAHYGLQKPRWRKEEEILYPETNECLAKLSTKYKIGIIANQSKGSKERLEAFDILKYIDLVIASAEEGVSKPDLRIFKIALDRANCMPQNALMIGDRLDNDIAPANKSGMKTIWIRQGFSRFSTPRTEIEKADYIVDNLNDVMGLLI